MAMTKNALAVLAALLALSACGLRGDLERPAPLFGEAPTDGGAEADLTEEGEAFDDEPEALDGPRFNEFGGVIPEASPVDPVEEAPLDEPSAE